MKTLKEFNNDTVFENDEDFAFNTLIWAASILNSGNNEYQENFYKAQHRKIVDKYNRTWGSGRD